MHPRYLSRRLGICCFTLALCCNGDLPLFIVFFVSIHIFTSLAMLAALRLFFFEPVNPSRMTDWFFSSGLFPFELGCWTWKWHWWDNSPVRFINGKLSITGTNFATRVSTVLAGILLISNHLLTSFNAVISWTNDLWTTNSYCLRIHLMDDSSSDGPSCTYNCSYRCVPNSNSDFCIIHDHCVPASATSALLQSQRKHILVGGGRTPLYDVTGKVPRWRAWYSNNESKLESIAVLTALSAASFLLPFCSRTSTTLRTVYFHSLSSWHFHSHKQPLLILSLPHLFTSPPASFTKLRLHADSRISIGLVLSADIHKSFSASGSMKRLFFFLHNPRPRRKSTRKHHPMLTWYLCVSLFHQLIVQPTLGAVLFIAFSLPLSRLLKRFSVNLYNHFHECSIHQRKPLTCCRISYTSSYLILASNLALLTSRRAARLSTSGRWSGTSRSAMRRRISSHLGRFFGS